MLDFQISFGYFFLSRGGACGCVADEGSLAGKLSSLASSISHSSWAGSAGLGCGGNLVPCGFGVAGFFFCGIGQPPFWHDSLIQTPPPPGFRPSVLGRRTGLLGAVVPFFQPL